MKEITISINEDGYRAAIAAAARKRVSLEGLVQDFQARLRIVGGLSEPGSEAEPVTNQNHEENAKELASFFADLNAKTRQDAPSVGLLNREELYERGIRGY